MPAPLRSALDAGDPILFVSPHLDDAVLSCGALLEMAARHCPVVVATIFTAAGPPPHTHAARGFMRTCGVGDAASLYSARRREDADVLAQLAVQPVHLGFADALFRRRRHGGRMRERLGRVVPELEHRYPTYHFDIARGRLAHGDRSLVGDVMAAIRATARRAGARLLFCPLGVGRHVDHLIGRLAGAQFPEHAVYYSDFPYDLAAPVDARFVSAHALTPWSLSSGVAAKGRLISGYRSQVDGLFRGGVIPAVPEVYYCPRP
jgi:LmbE family N-acetylglucosaminyl deacetylase